MIEQGDRGRYVGWAQDPGWEEVVNVVATRHGLKESAHTIEHILLSHFLQLHIWKPNTYV